MSRNQGRPLPRPPMATGLPPVSPTKVDKPKPVMVNETDSSIPPSKSNNSSRRGSHNNEDQKNLISQLSHSEPPFGDGADAVELVQPRNKVKKFISGMFQKRMDKIHNAKLQNITKKTSVDAADKNGVTALMDACKRGNLRLVIQLVETFHADVALADHEGRTAEDYAKLHDKKEVLQYLLDRKSGKCKTSHDVVVASQTTENDETKAAPTSLEFERGTLREIVEYSWKCFSNRGSEEEFFVLILNHKCFTTTEKLLDELQLMYDRPITKFSNDMRLWLLFKTKVVGVLQQWINSQPYDFIDIFTTHSFLVKLTCPPSVEDFAADLAPECTVALPLITRLRDEQLKLSKTFKKGTECVHEKVEELPVHFADTPSSITTELTLYTAAQLAEQLCFMDAALLNQLQMREFVNKNWTRKTVCVEKSPNVLRMIEAFNVRSRWVAGVVVSATDTQAATALIRMFIVTASILRQNLNFYGANYIISGLNMTPVNRLQKAWNLLTKNKEKAYMSLQDLFSSSKNYANLRTEMASVLDSSKPFIPNLALICNDIFKLEEIETIVDKSVPEPQINYGKFLKQYTVLKMLLEAQHRSYEDFMANDTLQYIVHRGVRTIMKMSEEDMFDSSYQLQPKSEEHSLAIEWKRASLDQRVAWLEEARQILKQEQDPVIAARALRAEKEKKQQIKEELLLQPYKVKLKKLEDWLARDLKENNRREADLISTKKKTSVSFLIPNYSVGKCISGHIVLQEQQGKFTLIVSPKKSEMFGEVQYRPVSECKLSEYSFYKGTSYGEFVKLKEKKNMFGSNVFTLIRSADKKELNVIFSDEYMKEYESFCNVLKENCC